MLGGIALALLPRHLDFGFPQASSFVETSGMSAEAEHLWTIDKVSELKFRVTPGTSIGLEFTVGALISSDVLPRQHACIFLGDQLLGEWEILSGWPRIRTLVVPRDLVPPSGDICLRFEVPTSATPASLGINRDQRSLGLWFWQLSWSPIVDEAAFLAIPYGRYVGTEARKTYDQKLRAGFWSKWITGPAVLDIGFQGYEGAGTRIAPIVEGAIGIDTNYPGYDGLTLPFETESQDAVYSSHCLEHIPHYIQSIQEWYRVTKLGGHIIVVVPSAMLFERRKRPPLRNTDHKRCYTPASLLSEFEQALAPNSYRVRHMAENDWRYDYSQPPNEDPQGCYEIELVIEKTSLPT